jgi:hypothetical protein
MNKALVKEWVEALRSGSYPQGRSMLNGRGGYCCWGVLCDILAKRGDGKWVESELAGRRAFLYAGGKDSLYPPAQLRQDLLNTTNINDSVVDKFAAMNDYGDSFAQIADAIEQHYKGQE